jgi:hypothetical protein
VAVAAAITRGPDVRFSSWTGVVEDDWAQWRTLTNGVETSRDAYSAAASNGYVPSNSHFINAHRVTATTGMTLAAIGFR